VAQLKLPFEVATKSDILRLIRNVDEVLDAFIENGVRDHEGVEFAQRPDVSSHLARLVSENDIQVSAELLKSLKLWLTHLSEKAPVVRFTFASDPTPEFLSKLVMWLRDESGQFVLIRYGIQPKVAAGCIVFTPSHRYDFSLRKQLLGSNNTFSEVLNRV
jgi:F0F1-type ATP synthase delta subunit